MFQGKSISNMSREELLDFARWASPQLEFLQRQSMVSLNERIDKEVMSNISPKKSFFTRLLNNLSI